MAQAGMAPNSRMIFLAHYAKQELMSIPIWKIFI
jgi:hypothetical protein